MDERIENGKEIAHELVLHDEVKRIIGQRLLDPRDEIYGSPELLMRRKALLTIPEVCYILRIGETSLRALRKARVLVPQDSKLRSVRYRTVDVQAHLASTRG